MVEIEDALEDFKLCEESEDDNRVVMLEDYEFSRLGYQWPEDIAAKRRRDRRPMLTLNRMPSFIRTVVNDSRQNKPQIVVKPVDDFADPVTADILTGIIRNIEQRSGADAAYDTAVEMGVSLGVGYIRVRYDYACEDSFDMQLIIDRVYDPFSVYRDPYSTAVDGTDWNLAFIVDRLSRDAFKREYPDAEEVSFQHSTVYAGEDWWDEDTVRVAEYWKREKVATELLRLSTGAVLIAPQYERLKDEYDASGITVVESRPTMTYRVVKRIMSGKEFLPVIGDATEYEWPGKYIPISPCYGDEVLWEGKRWFLALTHFAKDPQRQHNYWATSAAEKVALETKAPWIGPKGFAVSDYDKWMTANTDNHPFLEYDGSVMPQRNFSQGVPAADMQLALAATDEIKAVLGVYDPSLGQRSNETSGTAIRARQRQGSTATFHFVDNLSRCIRNVGVILVDLIAKTYTGPQVVRVLDEDGSSKMEQINQEVVINGQTTIRDVTTGSYDVVVKAGPSFGTRREEAAQQMTDLMQSFPAAGPLIGDLLVEALDWPKADAISKRLKTMLPPEIRELEQGDQEIPPEISQALQQRDEMIAQGTQMLEQAKAQLDELTAKLENAEAKSGVEAAKLQVEREKIDVERTKIGVEAFQAQTERMNLQAQAETERLNVQAQAENVQAQASAVEDFRTQALRIGDAILAVQDNISKATSATGRIVRLPDGSYVSEKTVVAVRPDGSQGESVQRSKAVKQPDGSFVTTTEVS